MALSRRTRSRISWYVFIVCAGIAAGFLYHGTTDVHTRIFSVAALSAVEGFLRPRRWLSSTLAGAAATIAAYMLLARSAPDVSVVPVIMISLLSFAGGMIVGVTGRKVFSSSNKRYPPNQ